MEEILIRAYLRLLANPDVGAAKLSRALVKFGSLQNITRQPIQGLQQQRVSKTFLSTIHSALQQNRHHTFDRACDESLAWAEGEKRQLIVYESANYPLLLRNISTPPPLLFAEGDCNLLHSPICAFVGSRRASDYGLRHSEWFAHELAEAGFTIASGLAKGIDGAAHKGALSATGKTIGVIGTGIDRIYPSSNKKLFDRLRQEGLVLSEFPLGAPPRSAHFPQRNRIISGISLGTVVIEATLRSGSLITARLAMEQNRDVFAVPGPIDRANAQGCHKLLQEGAKLVMSAEDIGVELVQGWGSGKVTMANKHCQQRDKAGSRTKKVSESLSSIEQRLIAAISEHDMLFDSIVAATNLPVSTVNSTLLELESKGLVTNSAGRVGLVQ